MKRTIRKTVFSVFLALLITLQSLPVAALFAELQSGAPSSSVIQTSEEETQAEQEETCEEMPVELPERRTETSKCYRMPDGSYYYAEYAEPVHYRDNAGEWQEIDNTLHYESAEEESGSAGYQAENGLKVKFAQNSHADKLVFVKDGAYQIGIGVVGGENNSRAVVSAAETEPSEKQEALRRLRHCTSR